MIDLSWSLFFESKKVFLFGESFLFFLFVVFAPNLIKNLNNSFLDDFL
jgi:hypothetical protein